ncbi:type I restriction enzyme HsdR N-terminal domain-containing protein [Candidatus Albibeggiatoa sp. nov. NOAA]|uniref:type I restriction enzyme HsdR N-terminal domain-containing protein n=1 Tax=Candidatus Albibeggiatoa sp. nov. NOAA TaxID=3162724 RepID=UPI003300328C|nr:type I restriction enzyme HsdR N-terminal domain-containing protein [Thiotrichaceae bacterium]
MAKTQCPECQARYTIKPSRVEQIVGQTVTCKVCSARFTVELLPTPPTEQHEESEEADTQETKTPTRKYKRRSQAEIRQEYIDNLATRFREHHQTLIEIDAAEKPSVATVRDWVYQVLIHCFDYTEQDIVTDVLYGDSRIDMLVHENTEDPPKILFNILNTRRSLTHKLVEKIKKDTFALGAPFAVLTNGGIWRFFRADKLDGESRFVEIANIPILDEDGVSDTDAEELYLLSKRALQRGDTEKTSHQIAALQPHRITEALFETSVLSKINRTLSQNYKTEAGVNVNIAPEILQQKIEEILTTSNL